MQFVKLAILVICLLALAVPGHAVGNSAYQVSPQVPPGSWTYPALDRVVALCQVKTGLAGTRPLTRLEAARLVMEASLKAALYAVPDQARMLLVRLKGEFRDEIAYLAAEQGTGGPLPDKLLREAEVLYIYQDGKKSAVPGTDASQFALNYNNTGRKYDNHHNGEFSLLGDAIFFDHLLLSWQPLVRARQDEGAQLTTRTALAAVNYAGIELSVGRQSLWWGQGRHGSLILTDNAKPLDMVRLTNPSPLQLPWLFKYLGPFRFDSFLSRLDNDRVVDHPYFGGLRFNFKPSEYFEFGASRTVMFGGKGQPNLDFGDFLTILGGENISSGPDTSNSIAGVDALINFPLLWGAQLYGEFYGEDEAGMLPSKNSWLAGLYLPQIEPSGTLSLRIEYADTTTIGSSPVLYRHGTYKSGYIYEGQIMGHHAGGDAVDLSVELGVDWSASLSWSIGVDYEERGKSQDVQEKHAQADIAGTWWIKPDLSLSARLAYDHVENWNFANGNENFSLASLGLGYSW